MIYSERNIKSTKRVRQFDTGSKSKDLFRQLSAQEICSSYAGMYFGPLQSLLTAQLGVNVYKSS